MRPRTSPACSSQLEGHFDDLAPSAPRIERWRTRRRRRRRPRRPRGRRAASRRSWTRLRAPQGQNRFAAFLHSISRMMLFYMVFRFFFGQSGTQQAAVAPPGAAGPASQFKGICRNIFPDRTVLDLYVYQSESPEFYEFDQPDTLLWKETGIVYGDWTVARSRSVTVPLSESVQHNGTLYLHAYAVKQGHSPNELDDNFKTDALTEAHFTLTKYRPRRKEKVLHNLLAGDAEPATQQTATAAATPAGEIVAYIHPNVSIALVTDQMAFPHNQYPAPNVNRITLDKETGNYRPNLYRNEFWLLREDEVPINDTVKAITLHLDFSPISLQKWQIQTQFDMSLQAQRELGVVEDNMDDIKHMLLNTNPWLLGVTFIVSTLHSIFDFLAFKNDIQFWRKRKSMEGLSVRTILVNVVIQAIIFLYLLDNDTSMLILVSSGVGLLIEIWKIQKALIVKVDWSGGVPRLSFKERQSYTSRTKEHDETAFRYLAIATVPLVVAYSIYSLLYESHKSWYSYIINTLVGFVYTFGFIMMTPQLFINYKLKSVAHMPWKTFMYKALNTVVDDLFAFIIRMPTLHRLACFRDDIIFVIYLYQRWKYPVDTTRVNEFGQGGADDEDEDEATEPAPAAAATAAAANGATSALEKKTQ